MNTFKVICKALGGAWSPTQKPFKIITNSKFFGLIKTTRLDVDNNATNPGPTKDEICIVSLVYDVDECTYYRIDGYGGMGYDSKWFIRLDEITETQKEIAEKAIPVLN